MKQLAVIFFFGATSCLAGSTVKTSLGLIHGECTAASCHYLNIPFANPFKRFEASRARTVMYPPDGVGGSTFGPACYQWVRGMFNGISSESEDCLTLNIWTPVNATGGLPVLYWIHGGGFLAGSAGQADPTPANGPNYNGSLLASRFNAVVVTVQYRLGPFGFLQTRSDGGGGANGLGDQLTGLEWVHRHIMLFGASPSLVTIFGESSGSVSVCTLAHLPRARGLFRRVIPQSGVCYPSLDLIMTKQQGAAARAAYHVVLVNGGIEHPEEFLDSADAAAIINTTLSAVPSTIHLFQAGIGQPSVDGLILPALPVELDPLPVDLLIGVTSWDNPSTTKVPGGSLLRYFGAHLGYSTTSRILSHYPANAPVRDVVDDACIRCQVASFAHRMAAKNSSNKVYSYVYDYPHGVALHTSDVGAVFGTQSMDANISIPPAVVQQVQRVWTQFAKTGMPGIRSWPAVQPELYVEAMSLGEQLYRTAIEGDACASWVRAVDAAGGFNTTAMCAALDHDVN